MFHRFDPPAKHNPGWRDPPKRRMRRTRSEPLAEKLPTRLHLHCRVCGHQAVIHVKNGRAWRFRCSRCGNRAPTIR